MRNFKCVFVVLWHFEVLMSAREDLGASINAGPVHSHSEDIPVKFTSLRSCIPRFLALFGILE